MREFREIHVKFQPIQYKPAKFQCQKAVFRCRNTHKTDKWFTRANNHRLRRLFASEWNVHARLFNNCIKIATCQRYIINTNLIYCILYIASRKCVDSKFRSKNICLYDNMKLYYLEYFIIVNKFHTCHTNHVMCVCVCAVCVWRSVQQQLPSSCRRARRWRGCCSGAAGAA